MHLSNPPSLYDKASNSSGTDVLLCVKLWDGKHQMLGWLGTCVAKRTSTLSAILETLSTRVDVELGASTLVFVEEKSRLSPECLNVSCPISDLSLSSGSILVCMAVAAAAGRSSHEPSLCVSDSGTTPAAVSAAGAAGGAAVAAGGAVAAVAVNAATSVAAVAAAASVPGRVGDNRVCIVVLTHAGSCVLSR